MLKFQTKSTFTNIMMEEYWVHSLQEQKLSNKTNVTVTFLVLKSGYLYSYSSLCICWRAWNNNSHIYTEYLKKHLHANFKMYHPAHFLFNAIHHSPLMVCLSMRAAVTHSQPNSDSWPAYWKHWVTYRQPLNPPAQTPDPSLLYPGHEFYTLWRRTVFLAIYVFAWMGDESPWRLSTEPYLCELMWKCCISSAE